MKNTVVHVNDHLVARLEELSQETLTAEQLDNVVKRADATVKVATAITATGRMVLDAKRLCAEQTGDPVHERSRVQALDRAAPADPGQPPQRAAVCQRRGGGRAVRTLVAYSTLSCQETAMRTVVEQAEMMSAGRAE